LGDILALAAGAFWGGNTVVVRTTKLKTAPVTQVLFCQMWITCAVVMGFAVLSGQTAVTPSTTLGISLLFQIFVVSLTSYFMWFWLLERYLAARLGVLTFMTPMFGLVLGAWLLDEQVEHSFLFGACLVLIGVFLVNGQAWLQKKVWSKSQRNV
jgi:drug/metabolite transporter (DMT)-like permease